MKTNEVKQKLGKQSQFLIETSGLTTDKYKIVVLGYGRNRILKKANGKEFINTKYKESDNSIDKYWLFFRNDSLIQIKWGKPDEWNNNKEINALINSNN